MLLSQGEIDFVKSINLVDVIASLGYPVKRVGNMYTITTMDSMRIGPLLWHRFSTGEGGNVFQFCEKYENMNFRETALYVNELARGKKVRRVPKEILEHNRKPFILPKPNENYRRMYAYLHKQRGISYETIEFFKNSNLIYETENYHNIVFISTDKYGIPKHGFQRGTNSEKIFKGDVPGNDKRYGFNLFNEDSDELYVFEAAIDAMSFYDIYNEKRNSNLLALNMLSPAPLETFLQEHPNVKNVYLGLDNDLPGRTAMEDIVSNSKYNWSPQIHFTKLIDLEKFNNYKRCKDMNEYLCSSFFYKGYKERDAPKNKTHDNKRKKTR